MVKKIFLLLCSLFLIFLFVSCEKEGPAERAGEKLDEAVEKTGDTMKEAAENAGETIEKAGEKMKEAAE